MVGIIGPLALAHRQPMDAAQWRVYFVALQDVPSRLLQEAVDALLKDGGSFMPKPSEIRKAADQARLRLLAAVPYTGCDECGGTGWRTTSDRTVARCPCKQAYLSKLADLQLGPPLMTQLTDGESA